MIAIILDNRGAILSVVVEMHIRAAGLFEMDEVFAMVGIVGVIGIIDRFADTHAAGVVGEGDTLAGILHPAKLAALFPGVIPCSVGEVIADGIKRMRKLKCKVSDK